MNIFRYLYQRVEFIVMYYCNCTICRMCEEVAMVLGLDWVLLFLQSGLHSTTVIWGLRILVAVCSVQSILQKFKEGTSNGGWLRHTDHNKMALALGMR